MLHPPGPPASADELLRRLPLSATVVNMVASVDGRTVVDGGSTALGGVGDKAMFGALRRAADAVLAGIGTLRAERYRPIRTGAPLLIITRSGNVPWDIPLFASSEQRVGIAGPVVDVPAHVCARVEVVEPTEPAAALAALREALGVQTVLCEGGATLNRALLDAGVIDELFLTIDPTLRGGDSLGVLIGEQATADLELVWVLRSGSELLLRYARR